MTHSLKFPGYDAIALTNIREAVFDDPSMHASTSKKKCCFVLYLREPIKEFGVSTMKIRHVCDDVLELLTWFSYFSKQEKIDAMFLVKDELTGRESITRSIPRRV